MPWSGSEIQPEAGNAALSRYLDLARDIAARPDEIVDSQIRLHANNYVAVLIYNAEAAPLIRIKPSATSPSSPFHGNQTITFSPLSTPSAPNGANILRSPSVSRLMSVCQIFTTTFLNPGISTRIIRQNSSHVASSCGGGWCSTAGAGL